MPTLVTLPADSDADDDGAPDRPLPTVFVVHGGPMAHWRWGYDAESAVFVRRGYAVVRVNYRGSTWHGAAFLHALDDKYGTATVEDLETVRQWAVDAGIADPLAGATVATSRC